MGWASFGEGFTGAILKDMDAKKEEALRQKVRQEEFDFFERKEKLRLHLEEQALKTRVARTELFMDPATGKGIVKKFNANDEEIGTREANPWDVAQAKLKNRKDIASTEQAELELEELPAKNKRAKAESAAVIAASQASARANSASAATREWELDEFKAGRVPATRAAKVPGLRPGDARVSVDSFASNWEGDEAPGLAMLESSLPAGEADGIAMRSAQVAKSLKIIASSNSEAAQQAAEILDQALRVGPQEYKQVLADIEKELGGK